MMLPGFHPFLPFAIAAALALVTRGWLRGGILLAAPVIEELAWHSYGTDCFFKRFTLISASQFSLSQVRISIAKI